MNHLCLCLYMVYHLGSACDTRSAKGLSVPGGHWRIFRPITYALSINTSSHHHKPFSYRCSCSSSCSSSWCFFMCLLCSLPWSLTKLSLVYLFPALKHFLLFIIQPYFWISISARLDFLRSSMVLVALSVSICWSNCLSIQSLSCFGLLQSWLIHITFTLL